MNKCDKTFAEKRGYTGSNDPDELARFARQQLRDDFLSADVGITGCNFAIAESGTITLVTNEGNADMVYFRSRYADYRYGNGTGCTNLGKKWKY